MKTRLVETVTSNEDLVRLRIFDGEIAIDQAGAELLRLERAQNEALRREIAALRLQLQGLIR